MAEGIVAKHGKRPNGFFKSMDDESLISYAVKAIKESGFKTRKDLMRGDGGLYAALCSRGLIDKIGISSTKRAWSDFTLEQILSIARTFVDDNGIKSPKGLESENRALYEALQRRHLLGQIVFEERLGKWSAQSDDELLRAARDATGSVGPIDRHLLRIEAPAVLKNLNRRGLLSDSNSKGKCRNWAGMSDDELAAFAQRTARDEGIKSRSQFQKTHGSLYSTLSKRGVAGLLALEADKRNWRMFSDEQLISHAQTLVEERGIESRKKLRTEDETLYLSLLRRGLLDRIALSGRQGQLSIRADCELVAEAESLIMERGITTPTRLKKTDRELYLALKRRGLLDLDGLKSRHARRPWSKLNDDEVVSEANKLLAVSGISCWKELQRKDSGLHLVLHERKLMERINLPPPKPAKARAASARRWKSVDNGEVLDRARKVISEHSVTAKSDFAKIDYGLYKILLKRDLLGKLELDSERTRWSSMDDAQLVEHCKSLLGKEGITTLAKLRERHNGPYLALSRRGLIHLIGLSRQVRNFSSLSDSELIEKAKALMAKDGINNRSGFQMADRSLYACMAKRGLLVHLVFDELRRDWKSMSDNELLEVARRFIAEKRLSSPTELARADASLYSTLNRRKILSAIGFDTKVRPKGALFSMSDKELLELAINTISEKNISRKMDLREADGGLYQELWKRGLLERAFASIVLSKHREAVDGILNAIDSFGDPK